MKPTDAEFTILNVLWQEGASTVRQVNEKLNLERRVGYTNTLKMMQIMHDKGMLARDESSRSHVYSPLMNPSDVRQDILQGLINTVFGGRMSNLLIQALGTYKPSQKELEEIKSILNKFEENGDLD